MNHNLDSKHRIVFEEEILRLEAKRAKYDKEIGFLEDRKADCGAEIAYMKKMIAELDEKEKSK